MKNWLFFLGDEGEILIVPAQLSLVVKTCLGTGQPIFTLTYLKNRMWGWELLSCFKIA